MKNTQTRRRRLSLQAFTLLSRSMNCINEAVHAPLSEYGLTTSQFGVLEAIDHLGPLSQRELAEKILKTPGNLTTVIDNLEKRALVERRTDPADRRRQFIHLTGEGEALIQQTAPPHRKRIEDGFSTLTVEEIRQLAKISRKILEEYRS